MIANTRPAPAHHAPAATAPPQQVLQRSLAEQRFICAALQLYRFCALARCRRTHECHGEPQRCLATHGAAAPPEARDAVEAMLVAARYDRVREGDGGRWLLENYWREAAVFDTWIAGLESRDARAKRYALLARLRRKRKRALNKA